MLLRTGAAGTGAGLGDEDCVTQQSVEPQSQQAQLAAGARRAGVAATTCAQTSSRLNRMASAFLTVEL